MINIIVIFGWENIVDKRIKFCFVLKLRFLDKDYSFEFANNCGNGHVSNLHSEIQLSY